MSLQAMLKSSHSAAARSRLAPASLRSRATTVRALASAAPKPVHIVGISGSLRKASTNTGLLRAAQKHLPPGVTMEIADLHDLPTYNDDLWQGGTDESVLPPAIGKFRQTVLRGDALLFATPEYNLSITSALKAAIDWGWCSRGPNVFDGKAAAIMGSGGSGGTVRAQVALRQCAVNLNVHFLNGPEILLRRYENPHYFNENGDVVDPKIDGYIKNMVHALVEYSRKLKS